MAQQDNLPREDQNLVSTRSTSLFLSGTEMENEDERAWQLLHEMLITNAVGRPLGEQPEANLDMIYDVLDVGCGSGGWALQVAQAYPEMRVMGVDVSQTALSCAQAFAAIQHLENACFQVMEKMQPLSLPSESFDLVNARLTSGVLSPARWSAFLEEYTRLLRPGGVIRLTEGIWGIATAAAPAVIHLLDLCWKALSAVGYCDVPRLFPQTTMPLLVYDLRTRQFQGVSCRAWMLDYSSGTSLHSSFVEGCKRLFRHARSFVIQEHLVTEEEVDQLYHQALIEVSSERFVALLSLFTAWGTRPQERTLQGAHSHGKGK